MEPLKRYVEQLDPTLVYTIMTQIFKDKKMDITALLDEFDGKGKLYTNIQKTIRNDKETTKIIEGQLHQNILNEFEKMAA
jgi:predicted DNA-binding ribbon-helix-helix protein